MYLTGDGRVQALDAQDGSRIWTSERIGAGSEPAAAYHRIIVSAGDRVAALDIEDGTLDWEAPFNEGPTVPTVAYESVFVIVGDTLYAFNVEDGSVRWERGPVETDEEFEFSNLAASNGQVYGFVSADGGETYLAAFDAMTGERQWEIAHIFSTRHRLNESNALAPSSSRLGSTDYGNVTRPEFVRNRTPSSAGISCKPRVLDFLDFDFSHDIRRSPSKASEFKDTLNNIVISALGGPSFLPGGSLVVSRHAD